MAKRRNKELECEARAEHLLPARETEAVHQHADLAVLYSSDRVQLQDQNRGQ